MQIVGWTTLNLLLQSFEEKHHQLLNYPLFGEVALKSKISAQKKVKTCVEQNVAIETYPKISGRLQKIYFNYQISNLLSKLYVDVISTKLF